MPDTRQTFNEQRVTVGVLRGLPSYKRKLKSKINNIRKSTGVQVTLEGLIERGINLALAEFGEDPITGRLQGRYSEKS